MDSRTALAGSEVEGGGEGGGQEGEQGGTSQHVGDLVAVWLEFSSKASLWREGVEGIMILAVRPQDILYVLTQPTHSNLFHRRILLSRVFLEMTFVMIENLAICFGRAEVTWSVLWGIRA